MYEREDILISRRPAKGAPMTSSSLPLHLDPATTALLLIDPQNWTLGMPLQPHDRASIVARAVALTQALRARGGTLMASRAAFSPGYADLLRTPVDLELKVPDGGIPEAALAFDAAIGEVDFDVVLTKRQWSAFHGTELDLQLRRRGVRTLLLGGVMTNFGVESTARDSWQHHYETVVVEDLCASLDADMHDFSIARILPRVARVRFTAAVIEALG